MSKISHALIWGVLISSVLSAPAAAETVAAAAASLPQPPNTASAQAKEEILDMGRVSGPYAARLSQPESLPCNTAEDMSRVS